MNAKGVFAGALIDADLAEPTTLPKFPSAVNFLEVAGSVYIKDASFGSLELLIENLSHLLAAGRFVAENAVSFHSIVVSVGHVSVVVQELVLVDGQAVISGFVAFSRVCAGVAHHDALELDDGLLGRGQFVVLEDFVGQVRDVDACVALAGHVEVVLLQVGELDEESEKSSQIVDGDCVVIQGLGIAHAETDLSYAWITPWGELM